MNEFTLKIPAPSLRAKEVSRLGNTFWPKISDDINELAMVCEDCAVVDANHFGSDNDI